MFDLQATFTELVPLTLCSTSRSPDVPSVSLSVFFAGFSSLALTSQSSGPDFLSPQCRLPLPEASNSHLSHRSPPSTAVSIIQLHPWHHHWPPHRHLKLTMFQTDLIILLPNLVLHLDGPVQCWEPSGTARSASPLTSSQPQVL